MIRRSLPRVIVLLCVLALTSCGGGNSSPTAPSNTTNTTNTPAVTTFTISGTVTSAAGGGISGATVSVADPSPNANAGKSAVTDGSGKYAIAGMKTGGMTINASAGGYVTLGKGQSIATATDTTLNFSLLPSTLWSQTGSGDSVFAIPSYVTKIRITGVATTSCANFIVHVSTQTVSLVNVIVGTCSVADTSNFAGTYAISGGGTITITSSTGISWTFVEAR